MSLRVLCPDRRRVAPRPPLRPPIGSTPSRTISSHTRRSLPARTTAISSSSQYNKQRDLYRRDADRRRGRRRPKFVTPRRQHTWTYSRNAPNMKFVGVGKLRRRRPRGCHLYPRTGRQPLSGRRRLDLRRQFQPHHEPDAAEPRRVHLAGFRRLGEAGRRGHQGARPRAGAASRRVRRSSSLAGRRAARSAGT